MTIALWAAVIAERKCPPAVLRAAERLAAFRVAAAAAAIYHRHFARRRRWLPRRVSGTRLAAGQVRRMRFSLIDRIVQLDPGQRITAVKSLSLAEEYLADHFPRAPVIPGVLMLEGLTQAACWLVRASEDFAHSLVVLKEARSVKYANFVEPGQTMRIEAELLSQDDRTTKLKAQATVNGSPCVSARLVLERTNLAEGNPDLAGADAYLTARLRELLAILWRPEAEVPA
jgi:3-hydroxyacyl-[acyl-carrier-protein] dehydratase